jgi:hypothetical protein
LLALLAQSATFAVGAARWQALFPGSRPVRLRRLTAALLVAQLVNIAFPVRLGPLVRAYLVGQGGGRDKVAVLATVAGEKLLDMVALAGGGLLLLWLLPLPAWAQRAGVAAVLAAAVGLLAALLLVGGRRWLEGWLVRFGERVTGAGVLVLDGVAAWLRPGRACILILWTAAIWAMGMLVNWLVLIALGIPGRFSIAAVLLVLLQMGGRVPGLPASIGIFEALCIIGLGWFAIGPGLGLGYGVALHAVVLLPGLVGGAFVLWRDSVARVGLQQITGRGAGSV